MNDRASDGLWNVEEAIPQLEACANRTGPDTRLGVRAQLRAHKPKDSLELGPINSKQNFLSAGQRALKEQL